MLLLLALFKHFDTLVVDGRLLLVEDELGILVDVVEPILCLVVEVECSPVEISVEAIVGPFMKRGAGRLRGRSVG